MVFSKIFSIILICPFTISMRYWLLLWIVFNFISIVLIVSFEWIVVGIAQLRPWPIDGNVFTIGLSSLEVNDDNALLCSMHMMFWYHQIINTLNEYRLLFLLWHHGCSWFYSIVMLLLFIPLWLSRQSKISSKGLVIVDRHRMNIGCVYTDVR